MHASNKSIIGFDLLGNIFLNIVYFNGVVLDSLVVMDYEN
jgi:hypothetical protein